MTVNKKCHLHADL